MSLHNKLRNIYPSLTDVDFYPIDGTISLQNDSDGKIDYIVAWNHPTLAKPTEAQLASASDDWSPPVPSTAEKLAAAGVSIDELKALLGLH